MTPLQGYLCHQQRTLPCTWPWLANVILYSLTVGQWWMGSSCTCRHREILISRKDTTTGGLMITMWLLFTIALFNVPGSVHNSQVVEMGQIHRKLEKVYERTGGKCCVDSAFANVNRQYLYKYCQDLLGSLAPTQAERKIKLQKKREATSARLADTNVTCDPILL